MLLNAMRIKSKSLQMKPKKLRPKKLKLLVSEKWKT